MRRGRVLAVSSALLFMSVAFAPCHSTPPLHAAGEALSTGASVLISEFYPCGLQDDEYFRLKSEEQVTIDLLNWSLTDGEGVLRFRKSQLLLPFASLTISMNSSSFLSAYGVRPDISMTDKPVQTDLAINGSWRLSDAGDSLSLLNPVGRVVDSVIYGNCSDLTACWVGPPVPALRKGEIGKRVTTGSHCLDTDSAKDWEPFREYRYGFTEFEPFETTVAPGSLTSFVSPDCSLDVVTDTLSSAQSIIRLCAYELDSAVVCTSLLQAASRGVDVRVLLDGAPAGGIGERGLACASALVSGGVDLRIVLGNLSLKTVQHIGPLHAKYLVVDSRTSIVLSENFVESGVPVDKLCGNRGWGIRIEDSRAATYLAGLFDSDDRASRRDVIEWRTDARFDASAVLPASPEAIHSRGILHPLQSAGGGRIRLVPSPDGSLVEPFLQPLLESAASVRTEQFQVDLTWSTRWEQAPKFSPLLGSLRDAMSRGANIEMLLDSTWFNEDMNSAAASHMSSEALNQSWAGEFKLLDPSSPITVLHNKGAVIDGSTVMISSNNWGYSSFARNRELAVIIDSDEVAAYFLHAFALDWTADGIPPTAYAGEDQTVGLGERVQLDAAGSSDDQVVASWAWDIDEDGEIECTDEKVWFFATRPGRMEISLTVEDAWGNKGYDTVAIEVRSNGGSTVPVKVPPGPYGVLVMVLGGSVGIMTGLLTARNRLHRARKLNHPKRD